MTNEPANQDALQDLIVGHFDGRLSDEEEKELAKALSTSAEAKQLFLSYMRMEGRLHSLGRDGCLRDPDDEHTIEPEQVSPQPKDDPPVIISSRQRLRLFAASMSLAIVAVVLLILSSGVLWPSPVSASSVLKRTQQVAAEMIDRRYRMIESRGTTQGSTLRDLVITVRGGGRFVVQPTHGSYLMGTDGTDYWFARKNGPVFVTDDFRSLAPALKKRIPNKSLLNTVLASPEEPLLLEMSDLLRLIERRYDIELVKSTNPAEHHVRATRRTKLRGGASVINLKADAKSGVVFWADMEFPKRRRTFELIETPTLSSQWYHYSEHTADLPVERLDATD